MADQKPQSHITTPKELVSLYESLYDRFWNKETGGFKDPVTVTRSLLHQGRIAAARLGDYLERLVSLEKRVAELEAFKKEAEEMATAMMKQFGETPEGAPAPANAAASAPTLSAVTTSPPTADAPAEAANAPAGTITDITSAATKPKKIGKKGETA